MIKIRNRVVDILRGIAMLMVILQHTISGCVSNVENTLLMNILWTLQMPLFFLISGYVTRYGMPLNSCKRFRKFMAKKFLAYLLPWIVWTFVVRGFIFRQNSFFDFKRLVYHMDSDYCFLFTICTITLVFGFVKFVSDKWFFKKNQYHRIIVTFIVYVLGMAVLGAIGIVMGISFLCIKFTLYYMPFYFAGYLYGQLQPVFENKKFGLSFIEGIIALCFIIWVILIERYNFYSINDAGLGIVIRAIASLAGCVAISGFVSKIEHQTSVNIKENVLQYVGQHSLEIYLVHNLVLVMIRSEVPLMLQSFQGILLVFLNYLLTVSISIGITMLLNRNEILKLILFGKSKNRTKQND